jgi:hypothetical protein
MENMKPQIIFSDGMGVESTAIMLRWIKDPESRFIMVDGEKVSFELKDLIVITSMVGSEWNDTIADREKYILPLYREHGVRYVQVARGGHLEAEGIVVLDDSRNPETLFHKGVYTLVDELRAGGSIPQSAGTHLCSLKFKAWVIETWLDKNVYGAIRHGFGYNADETSRAADSDREMAKRAARVGFGFNADETGRADEGTKFDRPERIAFYPLIEWGWNRERCVEYIRQALGITWRKSACSFCPFSHNRQGKAELFARQAEFPEQVAEALELEHVALSLNPRAALYKTKTLIQITIDNENRGALEQFGERLESKDWAMYRVRRVYSKPGKADRCVEKMTAGKRNDIVHQLHEIGGDLKVEHGIEYFYQQQRGEQYPAKEEFYVAAPAVMETKARYGVEWFNTKRWN